MSPAAAASLASTSATSCRPAGSWGGFGAGACGDSAAVAGDSFELDKLRLQVVRNAGRVLGPVLRGFGFVRAALTFSHVATPVIPYGG